MFYRTRNHVLDLTVCGSNNQIRRVRAGKNRSSIMANQPQNPDENTPDDQIHVNDGISSELYHSLRAARRRCLIRILVNRDNEDVTTRYLARRIAARELNVTPAKATGDPYRNVYNALSQTHLSTLAQAGIIIYDPQRQQVVSGPTLPIAALLLSLGDSTIECFDILNLYGLPDPDE